MPTDPNITAITIVYNGERFIREAVDSILAQTYEDFEYIIVDNNSTDNTPKILRDYAQKDERINVVNESKQGIFYARNAGLKAAKGDWIAVLDADDVALPNRLEVQLNLVKENPDVVLVGSNYVLIDEDGRVLSQWNCPVEDEALLSRLEKQRGFFAHSSSMFKRAVAAELDGYHSSYAEDYDLFLRLSMYGAIACVPQPLIKLRRHVGSHSYYIRQEPYILFRVVPLVCHLRRKRGLVDFSSKKDDKWEDFLKWTEAQMERLHVFEKGKASRELYRIWYTKDKSKIYRFLQILYSLLSNRFARQCLLDRRFMQKAAVDIAKLSETKFRG